MLNNLIFRPENSALTVEVAVSISLPRFQRSLQR